MNSKYLILSIILTPIFVFGQDKDMASCKVDTVEIILAYEFEGQCYIDDMIFKYPELIEYKEKKLTSKDYKSGVYQFITPFWTDVGKLKDCAIEIINDSIVSAKNPFHDLDTKTICQRNKSFKGNGTTQVGDEKIKWKYHDFKYKLFRVKFVWLYIGIEKRTIVNIDRKSKYGKETISIDCPIYVMIEIISIDELR